MLGSGWKSVLDYRPGESYGAVQQRAQSRLYALIASGDARKARAIVKALANADRFFRTPQPAFHRPGSFGGGRTTYTYSLPPSMTPKRSVWSRLRR